MSQSVLDTSVDRPNKDPYAKSPKAKNTKRFNATDLGEENDERFELSAGRSQSMLEQDDSFFFNNNKLLKKNLRARLGEETEMEMRRSGLKGLKQARCISEF